MQYKWHDKLYKFNDNTNEIGLKYHFYKEKNNTALKFIKKFIFFH